MDQNKSKDSIVKVIYHKRNESPKYIEIKKNRLVTFFIILPIITILGIIIGFIGLINSSPFHLIQKYRQNEKSKTQYEQGLKFQNQYQDLKASYEKLLALKNGLDQELNQLKTEQETLGGPIPQNNEKNLKCPPIKECPKETTLPTTISSSPNLNYLSLFRPVQQQKDRTRPASMSLTDFQSELVRDNLNFKFNINNLLGQENKLTGHIIVLMKNELHIQVYPMAAFYNKDYQISYNTGEPFATQRFRPVVASFLRPRKAGNYLFTIFIFAKNGDLIHFQNVPMTIKL